MKRSIPTLFCGLVLLCGQGSQAQAQAPVEQTAVDPITVRAANRKRLLSYVQAASAFSSDAQVSRRGNRLCPFVAGAPAEVNTYVASRIREVGDQIGVQFEEKACRPNLLVLFSREPQTMLQEARKRRKIFFEPATPTQIQRFMSSTRPIRWWHSVVVIPSMGTISATGDLNGSPEIKSLGTRLASSAQSVIRGSLIVVDASQTEGVEIGAIADYIALAALTDIKPEADLSGHASILNLFAQGEPTEQRAKRLTPLDIAYLRGVYKARSNASGMNQIGKIATAMAVELER